MKRKQPKRKRFINPLCCAKCKVNQAALDDAQKQFSEQVLTTKFVGRLYALSITDRNFLDLVAELNMSAYEDAQMHARTNHKLLTEAKEEIERLKLKAKNKENDADFWYDRYNRACGERNLLEKTVVMLKADVAHSDTERRMLERDVLSQQTQLKRWGRFDVVSSRLEGDHA